MHNILTRIQNTFGYLTSCAFFLAILISTVSLLPLPLDFTPTSSSPSQPPSAKLAVRNVQVVRGRPHYYSPKREEYAHIRFDLDADLSALFNWNTKQVFVYVSAEYPAEKQEPSIKLRQDGREGSLPLIGGSGRPRMNQAIIWDAILAAPATPWNFANVQERYFPTSPKGKKAATDKTKKSTSKSSPDTKSTSTDLTLPGLLTLKNQKPKYQITDPSGVLASRTNATLTLSWNVQPWVGPLLWDRSMLEHKRGAEAAQGSWNLPFLKHQWKGSVMPRSGSFDFPSIKAVGEKKTEGQQVVKVKEQEAAKTPKAAEVSGVV